MKPKDLVGFTSYSHQDLEYAARASYNNGCRAGFLCGFGIGVILTVWAGGLI